MPINTRFYILTIGGTGRLILNGVDWFARAFGAVVEDIRQRVVEEPWFGRAVTPPEHADRTASEALGWTNTRDAASNTSHPPDHAPEQDHDFER